MSIQQEKLLGIANAIRTKKGTTDLINANNFENEILNLPSGIELSGEELSVVVVEGNVIEGNFGSLSEDNLSVKPYDGTNPCNIIETGVVGKVIKVIKPYNIPTYRLIGTLNGIDFVENFNSTSEMKTFISTNKNSITGELTAIRISDEVLGSYSAIFENLEYVTKLDLKNFKSNNSNSGYRLFYRMRNLLDIDLTSLDITNFDTFSEVFQSCVNLVEVDMSMLNGANIVSGGNLFSSCSKLKRVKMYKGGSMITWNFTSMYSYCNALEEIDFTGFTPNLITTLDYLFFNCYNLKNVDLSNFNTSNVTNARNAFDNCLSMTIIDLSTWDLSLLNRSDNMFRGCTGVVEAYGRTQADCDILNATSEKPANVVFILKEQVELAQSIKDVIALGVAPTNDLESNNNILRGVSLNV